MSDMGKRFLERRKFVRLDASVDIFYTVVRENAYNQEQSLSKNISAGGLCLILYEEVKLGSVLKLGIYLPDEGPAIAVKGRVSWVQPFQVAGEKMRYDAGIEFFDMTDSDRERINKYVFRFT